MSAADQLRQDIGRISATRPDGMPTSALAEALAAEGWVKASDLLEKLEDRVLAEHGAFNPYSRAAVLVVDLQTLLASR